MTDAETSQDSAVVDYFNRTMEEFPEDDPSNLMGKRFGKLTACMPTPKTGPKGRLWMCRCKCGKMVVAGALDLMSGEMRSCGCTVAVSEDAELVELLSKRENLTGTWRGMLHVIQPKDPARLDEYICRCECGRMVTMTMEELMTRGPKSCGCLEASVKKDGPDLSTMVHHPLRFNWNSMKHRCRTKKGRDGQCFEVCSEWMDYENYYHWAYANGWSPGKVVVRKDIYKPYGPDNCVVGEKSDLGMSRRPRRTRYEMASDDIMSRLESMDPRGQGSDE